MGLSEIMSLVGGLALFLFGMNVMGSSLQKSAGSRLKTILESMTSSTFKGFLLGVGTTVVMQSSSATTVMVVGFVNSGIMTLSQSVGVIIGANLGATITPWLLSLTGVSGDGFIFQLIKPSTFVPVLAIVGVFLAFFQKNSKKKDIGMILLGFSTLMFGMEMMSDSVSSLRGNPDFIKILTMFENPVLGCLVGVVFTAIIQSSSASIGILQAISSSGGVTFASAIPIIMGQNIGTCVSAMISSIGASKNARRSAIIHLSFNIIATLVFLPIYYIAARLFFADLVSCTANPIGIAIANTSFKTAALVLMPFSAQFEKLSRIILPDKKGEKESKTSFLDDRLLNTPTVAVDTCYTVCEEMAHLAVSSFKSSMGLFTSYDAKLEEKIREEEEKIDIYEDKIGTYLLKLSGVSMTERDSVQVSKLLHLIGDFERISDHAVNICDTLAEMRDKKISFSADAKNEIAVITKAVDEIFDLSLRAFINGDSDAAFSVEPLEQVIDYLLDKIKSRHIRRLQNNVCTIEMGVVLSDLLINFERVSDHCSNIAACILETEHNVMDVHEYLQGVKGGDSESFNKLYAGYKEKYVLE